MSEFELKEDWAKMKDIQDNWTKAINLENANLMKVIGNQSDFKLKPLKQDDFNELFSLFEKASIDEFQEFINSDDYSYIPQRILRNFSFSDLYSNYLILVIYFFVRRHRSLLRSLYVFSDKDLNYIYSDLGIASPHPL